MTCPDDQAILARLAELDRIPADALEDEHLELKPWTGSKTSMRVAVEYAVCFANAAGGAVVFGVADGTVGRMAAIHGAKGYDLDIWRRAIYDGTRPGIPATVSELQVPEGTGTLVVVRVPAGATPPYGTAEGLYKRRIGMNCMPMDPASVARVRVATGAVDWSGEHASGVARGDLDPLEIERARSILRAHDPGSELFRQPDQPFLEGLEALRRGEVTHAGLVLFARPEVLSACCPQAQVHYVYQPTETQASRNDVWRFGLLRVLEAIEVNFTGPANPEEEITVGLFKLRVASFPIEVVREAVLNAVTHRDYLEPGEILIRHAPGELVVTSPGGFIGGIRPDNILHHEPVARNRTLANALLKLRLVEAAGTGRHRIFGPMLRYGKGLPRYESDGPAVTLSVPDTGCDQRLAQLVGTWNAEGRDIGLDGLLVLHFLRTQPFIDTAVASGLLQLDRERSRSVLDRLALPGSGILERQGKTRSATFRLAKGIARDLLGRVAYTRVRGLDPARHAALVREYLADHGSISNGEVRELLGLGDSPTAQVEASRHLRRWSGPEGFLTGYGRGSARRYRVRNGS